MSKGRGFFGFLKGLTREVQDEEVRQKDFALSRPSDDEEDEAIEAPSYDTNYEPDHGPSPSEITLDDDVVEYCTSMVSTILTAQGFAGDVKMGRVTRQRMIIDIESTDDLGRIIGRDGSHLEALQTLVRAIIHRKFSDLPKIILDAGAYRRRRRGALKAKAKEMGVKVLSTGKSIALEAMTSSERRMVHVLFEKDDKLQTLSKGNGRNRHVVIALRD